MTNKRTPFLQKITSGSGNGIRGDYVQILKVNQAILDPHSQRAGSYKIGAVIVNV